MFFIENITVVKFIMWLLILIMTISGAVCYRFGKWSKEQGYRLIVTMGIILRIGYLLYTPCTLRGHDIWELSPGAFGKAGYVLGIAVNGQLPTGYELQYYQQPLFFIFGGIFARLLGNLTALQGEAYYYFLTDMSRWIACAASCLILPVAGKLFDVFEMHGNVKLTGMLLVSFCPIFYLMGGWVGEDSLITLFMALALLFTVNYERSPSNRNILCLSLIYGFGMMTKISMVLPAVYTTYVFGKLLFKGEKKQKTLWQYILFLGISMPLGLWFSIRNFILFKQPIGYVLRQDKGGDLFTGDYSYIERFLLPDLRNLLSTPYANPLQDYNLSSYLLKSELFGEFTFQVPMWVPVILLFLHIVIEIRIAWEVLKIWKSREKSDDEKKLAVWYTGILLFSVFSYFTNPFGCTMNYRYIAVLSVVKGLIWGYFLMQERKKEERTWLSHIGISACSIWKRITVLFAGFSVLMYLLAS